MHAAVYFLIRHNEKALSTWNSLDDWNNWLQSKQRLQLQKQIDDLLVEVTQFHTPNKKPCNFALK
jgi:hypothetical protein